MKKNLIYTIIAIALAVATLIVGALLVFQNIGNTVVAIGDVKGLGGDTVEVPVTIEKNHGVWGGQIIIDYNADELTFLSASNGTVFEICESNGEGNNVALVMYSIPQGVKLENTKKDGVVATLKFKIKANAKKETYDLTFNSETNFCNAKEEMVEVHFNDGSIKVK